MVENLNWGADQGEHTMTGGVVLRIMAAGRSEVRKDEGVLSRWQSVMVKVGGGLDNGFGM